MDFYRTVHPILQGFGYPVTLYLTTYYCCVNKPVFPPALAYILWKGRGQAASYPRALNHHAQPMDLRTEEGRQAAHARIWAFAEGQAFSASEKHALLAEVASAVGYDFSTMLARRVHHLMNPDEVAKVSREGASTSSCTRIAIAGPSIGISSDARSATTERPSSS